MTRWLVVVALGTALCACGEAAGGAADATDAGSSAPTTEGDDGDDSTSTSTSAGDSAAGGRCDDTSGDLELTDDGGEGGTSGGGSAEDTGAGMGGDIPVGATVFEVRQGFVPAGTLVEIVDVVITAPIVPTTLGSLVFVQAPEGGEHSAITVSVADSVDAMPLGTRLHIIGQVGRRGALAEIVVRYADLHMVAPDGMGELPQPFVIQAADLADPALVLEPYDAALVRVETPEVIDEDVCPGEFSIAARLRIDDLFLGKLAPTPSAGSEYAAILGALRDTGSGFEIAPRSLDDLVE